MSRIVARLIGAGLGLTMAASAHASPKGYDVDRLLRQGTPEWLHGPSAAPVPAPAPAPQYQQQPLAAPQPLDRIPRMPAPAVLPDDGALTVPPPLPPPGRGMPQPNYGARQTPQRQVIRAPGSPRSSVSGAWSPPR